MLVFSWVWIDVFGRFEKKTFAFIKEICEPMAENSGYTKQQTMDYVFRSISITLMKDIAQAFKERTGKYWERNEMITKIDFYL